MIDVHSFSCNFFVLTIFLVTFWGDVFFSCHSYELRTKILAPDAQNQDIFGWSVSVSGDFTIVGAYDEDELGNSAGAAYIFKHLGNNVWDTGTKILPTDGKSGDQFGWSVSIDGDYAIVGSPYGASGGAAYIYKRNGSVWGYEQKIQSTDLEADDYFGISVSISGLYAIVGAPYEDTGGSSAGSAYIFRRTGDTWDTGKKIQAFDKEVDDLFGCSVGISGEHAIVGAQYEGAGLGTAYVIFRGVLDSWNAQTKIQAPDPEKLDLFGISVAIDGEYAIVGANFEDTGGSEAGAAYIYKRTGSVDWDVGTKIQAQDAEADDHFGIGVSISGDYAVVGAFNEDPDGAIDAGSAYVFKRTGGNTWDTGEKIQAFDKEGGDNFGRHVAVNADLVIVGASEKNNGRGVVYVESMSTIFPSETSEDTFVSVDSEGSIEDTLSLQDTIMSDDSEDPTGDTLSTDSENVIAQPDDTGVSTIFEKYQMVFIFGGIGGAVVLVICVVIVIIGLILSIVGCVKVAEMKRDQNKLKQIQDVDLVIAEQNVDRPNLNINPDLFEIKEDITLKKEIGSGGSESSIYSANWMGKMVAVKIFRQASFFGMCGEGSFETFEKELVFMSSLNHPNLVSWYGASLSRPKIAICMELMEGGDLEKYVQKQNQDGRIIPFEQKVRLLRDISSGLFYIHKKEVIHRDIKAENCFLTSDFSCCKLGDFGLSKFSNASKHNTRRVGTSAYMSPEVTLGGNYGVSTDIYSMGILIYFVLFQPIHIYNTKITNVENKVAQDPNFRPKIPRGHEFDEWVVKLMKRCWSHEEQKRPDIAVVFKSFQK